jgi:hypothetical protein
MTLFCLLRDLNTFKSYLMHYSMLSKFIFIPENATNDRYLSRYNPRSRGIPSVLLLNSICWLKCTREPQTQKRSLHRMIKLFFLQASLSLIIDGNSSDNDSIQEIRRIRNSFRKVKLVWRLSRALDRDGNELILFGVNDVDLHRIENETRSSSRT